MKIAKEVWCLLKPFVLFILTGLFLLFISRAGLLFWQIDHVNSFSVFYTVISHGLRIDLSSLAYLVMLPALFHPFIMLSKLSRYHVAWFALLKIWFFISLSFLLYFEFATPMFIDEYNLRPNRLFVEYLVYPKEVFSMLINGHLLPMLVTFITLIITLVIIWRTLMAKIFTLCSIKKATVFASSVAWVLFVSLLFLAARGTVGHRPINPALVYFSTDPLINSLTLNSAYSVAFAIKQLKNEKNSAKMYGKLSKQDVIDTVRGSTHMAPSQFLHADIPTLAHHQASYRGKAKNLVIILQESLGAQFTGHLGGKGITPRLDQLMKEGWSFNQLYATGTRSVRGIEAVITGFTPTPARSVVKLDKSQHNFFTIAELLKRNNYQTQFIYGGESHFDNMKSFFLGNGFTDIVDFDDIINPEFVASWGASDGDLFKQADIELTQLHQQNRPFFSLIFTSSNHSPFDIPVEKILPSGDDHLPQDQESRRERAISYADYALGNFIDRAKKSAYWKNTIFLVVSDHDARTWGSELVPIKSFHIPGVILGHDIPAKQDNRLVSQIDLAPTLLSLIGLTDEHPMLGHDLTQDAIEERAILQFYNNFAYMTPEKVAILQPEKPIMYFRYDFTKKHLMPASSDKALGKKALAHALFGSYAYNNNWYKLAEIGNE